MVNEAFCIMVAKVTRSCMLHIQTTQDIFILLKGAAPSYLVLKFGNFLHINNWYMAQNVISQRSGPWKVKIIGQNKWHHQVPWPWKHIYLDAKIVLLSALGWKLWSKTSFCIMLANVTRSRTSHTQTAQDVFWFVERPPPKLLSVKIWWQFV